MGAISSGSPGSFQSAIQQTESQNQAEIQQRREAQETLRQERTEQTDESQQTQQAGGNQQATLENSNEGQRAADPNQRVGGQIDIQV